MYPLSYGTIIHHIGLRGLVSLCVRPPRIRARSETDSVAYIYSACSSLCRIITTSSSSVTCTMNVRRAKCTRTHRCIPRQVWKWTWLAYIVYMFVCHTTRKLGTKNLYAKLQLKSVFHNVHIPARQGVRREDPWGSCCRCPADPLAPLNRNSLGR